MVGARQATRKLMLRLSYNSNGLGVRARMPNAFPDTAGFSQALMTSHRKFKEKEKKIYFNAKSKVLL